MCYQDSMHPWVKSDQPGKCTICAMDLTPIHEGQESTSAHEGLVVLSSNTVTVMNVASGEVGRKALSFGLRVAGTLEADETRKNIFSAPAAGRIEVMAVEAVGDVVQADQPLFTFYSPELATWRRAYVVRTRSATGPAFAGRPHEGPEPLSRGKQAAKAQVAAQPAMAAPNQDADPYFSDLLSPLSGTVVERKVFNGQYVTEGDQLLTIVDTSVLWFRFDVYERQLSWLRKGQNIRVTVPSVPGKEFAAVISAIEPKVDQTTRTVKVRATLQNPLLEGTEGMQRMLFLGMYAEGAVHAEVPDVLTVPRSAILYPGGQAYVYVEQGAGAYARTPVRLGRQGDHEWEVLEGLEEGDRVVTAGNVLMDAQAQLTEPAGQAEARTVLAQTAPPDSNPEGSALTTALPAKQHAAPSSEQQTSAKPAPLTASQSKALRDFLKVAGGISEALASDDLENLKLELSRLEAAQSFLSRELAEDAQLAVAMKEISSACTWSEPSDLATARKSFLPFSTKVVELVERLRGGQDDFRSLKVYHCPMAPKPGLWYQSKGPLRNPFYGAAMLACGEEVRVRPSSRGVAVALVNDPPSPGSSRDQALPSARRLPSGVSLGTAKTRNPEAEERMARTFAKGLAERHNAATTNLAKHTPDALRVANSAEDLPRGSSTRE